MTLTNTELAILGLVAEQPRHGYQIEQDITARGMRNWTEIGFSSIYYILNKLEKAGWLASQLKAQGGGPARKVYHLTAPGGQVYREAVRQRLAEPRPRSGDFDLALANLPALPPAEAREALLCYQASLRARLAQVQAKRQADRAQQGSLPPHAEALFDHSLVLIEAELAWVTRFLASDPPGVNP